MNMYVLMSCFMQRIKIINPVTGDTIPGSERGYGFFARETDAGLESDYQQCSYYAAEETDSVFDAWVRSARFFTFVSEFLGILCFLILLNTCWCAFSEETFSRWLFWFYLLAAGAISLSFLVFGSEFCGDNRCKVAAGSGYAITTLMFWLSSCNTVKSIGGAMPKPPKDPNRPKRRRPWSRRKKSDDDEDIEQDMADLYYENEEDKYPIPECTPEGRKRYAAAAAFADDTDPQANMQQREDSDDSDSDDSDDDSDDSDDSDEDSETKGRDGVMYDKNAGRDGLMHGNGHTDDGYGNNGYNNNYDQGPHGQDGIEMGEYGGQAGEAPEYGEGYNHGQYDQGQYDQGAAQGFDGDGQGAQGQEGYDAYGQPGYDQPGYGQPGYDDTGAYHPNGSYDQGGYDDAGQYDHAAYGQPGYDQGAYSQPGYDQTAPYHGQHPDGMHDVHLHGAGYDENGPPQVGDPDGPTIT